MNAAFLHSQCTTRMLLCHPNYWRWENWAWTHSWTRYISFLTTKGFSDHHPTSPPRYCSQGQRVSFNKTVQHALTISVQRDLVISIQDSQVSTMFGICVKCNLINCLLELELIGTHGWRHHSMLEHCDKYFICGREKTRSCNPVQMFVRLLLGSLLKVGTMLQENTVAVPLAVNSIQPPLKLPSITWSPSWTVL